MLTFRKGAAAAPSAARAMVEHLLLETLAPERVGLAEYYTRGLEAGLHGPAAAGEGRGADATVRTGCVPTPRRDMHPRLAEALALDPGRAPSLGEVAAVLAGRRADGGELPLGAAGAAARSVSYVDLCFSAPKSVSLAWTFAPTEAERATVLQAHKDAVEEGLRYVAAAIGAARRGGGGRGGAEEGHVAWILFDHFTSRPTAEVARPDPQTGAVHTELHELRAGAGDPQLHTHCAVPNLVATDGGHLGALDLAAMRGRVHEFGAFYQAALAANLRRAGADVALDARTGMARLPAVPEAACAEFSKRTRDAEGAARAEAVRRGLDWDALSPDGKIAFLKGGAGASRKGRGDDLGDFAAWAGQAKALGWRHRGVLAGAGQGAAPAPPRAERLRRAYEAALPFLEAELARRAVLSGPDARAAAARGLIAAGLEGGPADVDAVTRLMRERGVRQGGRMTSLVWGRDGEGDGAVRLTTALHAAAEAEVVRLARAAAADRSGAADPDAAEAAARRRGLDLSGAHGAAQLGALRRLAAGGRFAVAVGAAGSGKTALLAPLAEVWTSGGREVHGVALAWRQAEALAEAGIPKGRCAALAPFLARAARGEVALGPRSVVVLDEIGQVGARQMLDLLRLRERRGFALVALGDDRQCQSVEAGPVLALVRRALGDGAIPEIVTTRRQRTAREREVAGLFRDGRAAEALALKREDGTAEMVPGGRAAAVARAADLWAERRAANRGDRGFTLTVSAPTHADAHALGEAIRDRRRALGELGPDLLAVDAADGSGAPRRLALAAGDRVRLLARANAAFADGAGRDGRRGATVGNIGNNGSVLEVAGADAEGVHLRTSEGRVGFVRWVSLRDGATGRVRLARGEALTVDAAQGLTSTEHIAALPSGSAALDGYKGYVAGSRHRERSWLVLSDGAERGEAAGRRALGDPRPVSAEDAWANAARNLARRPEKSSALLFLERAREAGRGAARAMQAGLRAREGRAAEGRPPPSLRASRARREEESAVSAALAGLREAAGRRWAALRALAEPDGAGEGAAASAGHGGVGEPRLAGRAARAAAGARAAWAAAGWPAPGALAAVAARRWEERAVAGAAERISVSLGERAAALRRIAGAPAQGTASARDRGAASAPAPAFPPGDAEVAFAEALRRAGLRVEGGRPLMDGRLHRAPVEGDRRGQRSGAYVGHLDGWPAGYVRNHRTGAEERWRAAAPARALAPAERAALVGETAARAERRARGRLEGQRRAALLAARMWDAARPVGPGAPHPYLAAKGVAAHGALRVDRRGRLLVPVRGADGALWGLQRIGPDGGKLFLKGARTEGGHLLLGAPAPGAPLLVAEGFATAATLHAATGHAVAVAFNAHNLEAVARAHRALDGARPIVVAGDDDRHLPLRTPPLPNVGRERAEAAAAAVGGVAALPPFAPGERGTDWNDFAAARPARALADALAAAVRRAAEGPTPAAAPVATEAAGVAARPPRRGLRA